MSIMHKGYEIKSTSIKLQEKDKWTTSVMILKHDSGGVSTLPFSTSNTFDTKEEADTHSVNFARQIIDGHHEGLSVSTM